MSCVTWSFNFSELQQNQFLSGGNEGFPGGPGVKNLPSNAGEAGSILGQGTKILHVSGQLSPSVATREPSCYNKDPAQPKFKNK